MIDYTLPKTVEVAGKDLAIRYDYRAILDCISILNADDLDDRERYMAIMEVFYEKPEEIENYEEAIKKAFDFIAYGSEKKNTEEKPFMDWEKDFKYIISAVNALHGYDLRGVKDYHWWSFLGDISEIDKDCPWCQIMSIRTKKNNGKDLEKYEKEFYYKHKDEIDLPVRLSKEENDAIPEWVRGVLNG